MYSPYRETAAVCEAASASQADELCTVSVLVSCVPTVSVCLAQYLLLFFLIFF